MIYIIFGASGSGKTMLLEILKNKFTGVSIHIKGTTRKLRQYDSEELVSYPGGLQAQYDYVYGQYGDEYGIEKCQIEKAIANNENHFIICNDIKVLEEIKLDFCGRPRGVYFHYPDPAETISTIQRSKKISDDQIPLRLSKINSLAESFIENCHLFDIVLNNVSSSNPRESLEIQIKNIFASNGAPEKTIRESLDELAQEIKKSFAPNTSVFQKGLLFLILPIRDENTAKDISFTIKTAAQNFGFTAERLDETFGYETINAKLLKHIELAEVVVADLTFERPNCYYEVGYAHALKKGVIFTAKRDTKIHVDINNYPVIFYDNMEQLNDKLTDALKQHKDMYT